MLILLVKSYGNAIILGTMKLKEALNKMIISERIKISSECSTTYEYMFAHIADFNRIPSKVLAIRLANSLQKRGFPVTKWDIRPSTSTEEWGRKRRAVLKKKPSKRILKVV